MNTINISTLRSNLANIINQISDYSQRVSVLVSGEPKAVILSTEELESLEETAEILTTPGSYTKIHKGINNAKLRQGISLDKL